MEDAYSLETISQIKEGAAIDPVAALGFRYAFADDFEKLVSCGNALNADKLALWETPIQLGLMEHDCCTSAARRSHAVPQEGELISVVLSNRLKAIYRFDSKSSSWKSDCVFSVGIRRTS